MKSQFEELPKDINLFLVPFTEKSYKKFDLWRIYGNQCKLV